MPLGREVGLGPCRILLDGDPPPRPLAGLKLYGPGTRPKPLNSRTADGIIKQFEL